MRVVIRAVVVLVGKPRSRDGRRDEGRLSVEAFRIPRRPIAIDENELRAERAQAAELLRTRFFSDDDLQVQSFEGRHHGEPHRGVSRGGFNHGASYL